MKMSEESTAHVLCHWLLNKFDVIENGAPELLELPCVLAKPQHQIQDQNRCGVTIASERQEPLYWKLSWFTEPLYTKVFTEACRMTPQI